MSSQFIKRITRIGLDESIDILDYQRVLLTNALTLAVVGFCIVLLAISAAFELYVHVIIAIGTAFLVMPVLWFNLSECMEWPPCIWFILWDLPFSYRPILLSK